MRSRLFTAVLVIFLSGHVISLVSAQGRDSYYIDNVTLEMTDGHLIELLETDGAELSDVISILSQKSDFNILMNDGIKGKVTIFLTDIELRDALRIMLDGLGLAFSEQNMELNGEEKNIIQIMSREEFKDTFGYAFGRELSTKIVPLVYIGPAQIQDVLEAMKTEDGKIIYNTESNTFVLMDEPKALKAMEDVIKKLDVAISSREFILHSQSAEVVESQVRERLTKNVGQLEINEKKNSIIVTDTLLKIKEIGRLLEDLDAAGKKIQIDVKVIQITLNDEHETGVDWEAIVSNYQKLRFTAFDTEQVLTKDKEHLSFGTITAEDLNILTEALETVGEIKTVFVDQFTVENRAEIQFKIPVEAVSSVEKEISLQDLSPASDDVKFYLTSKLAEESIISTTILPAKFKIADKETVDRKRQNILMRSVSRGADFIRSATSIIPIIGDVNSRIREGDLVEERFSDDVEINVQDGSSIVIGTMIKEVMVKKLRKIPLLGDLPLLGFAFQTEGEKLRNTEVMVFLTIQTVDE